MEGRAAAARPGIRCDQRLQQHLPDRQRERRDTPPVRPVAHRWRKFEVSFLKPDGEWRCKSTCQAVQLLAWKAAQSRQCNRCFCDTYETVGSRLCKTSRYKAKRTIHVMRPTSLAFVVYARCLH